MLELQFLVNDSTNLDGTADTPGANPAPNPVVALVPANTPVGGWDDTVQSALQWSGAAWLFIRFQAANPDDRYINEIDGTPNTDADRQRIAWNGLDLVCAGPDDAQGNPTEIVGYEMRFHLMDLAHLKCKSMVVQVLLNQQNCKYPLVIKLVVVILTVCSFGPVIALTEMGRIDFTGTNTDNERVLAYTHRGGTSWNLDCDGDFETVGDIQFANIVPTAGQDRFLAGITATPTENYTITLPPTGPAEAGQVLVSDANGQLAWGQGGGAGTVIGPIANFTDPITGQTIIPPGGQLFDNDANRLYISVTTEPDQNGVTANVLVQLVP